MNRQDIHKHWSSWANSYGTDLRATTKAATSKALEIDALVRRVRSLFGRDPDISVLEAGCGNGVNCVALAKQFPAIRLDGFDFVEQMVAAAEKNAAAANVGGAVRFFVGDVVDVGSHDALRPQYDLVFTDRCLINLNSVELQKAAITALASRVGGGGYLFMIENSRQTYRNQNLGREALGLSPREPAEFNLFFDEDEIRPHLAAIGLELIDVEDFISLHDLVLYVLLPAVNGGKVDYEHPLVAATARLSAELAASEPAGFGSFGQNRLYVCRKRTSSSV